MYYWDYCNGFLLSVSQISTDNKLSCIYIKLYKKWWKYHWPLVVPTFKVVFRLWFGKGPKKLRLVDNIHPTLLSLKIENVIKVRGHRSLLKMFLFFKIIFILSRFPCCAESRMLEMYPTRLSSWSPDQSKGRKSHVCCRWTLFGKLYPVIHRTQSKLFFKWGRSGLKGVGEIKVCFLRRGCLSGVRRIWHVDGLRAYDVRFLSMIPPFSFGDWLQLIALLKLTGLKSI